MTDFPYVGPPTDGLQLAMATARSRRLRKAGVSSSLTAFTLASVAVLAGTTGRVTLVQEPPAEIPAVTSVDQVPSGAVEQPQANTPRPGSIAAFDAATSASGVAGRPGQGSAASGTGGQGGGGRSGSGGSSAPSPTATGPMKSGYGSPNPIDSCPLQKSQQGQTLLCPNAFTSDVYSDDNSTVVAAELTGAVCSFDTRVIDLHFATTRELDLVVKDSRNREVWRWSTEHPAAPNAHTVRLTTGDCWQWTTSWAFVDQAGRPLAKGDYTVHAISLASELGRQNNATTTYSIR